MAGNTEYKNKYAAEKYDRIGLMLKKGSKNELLDAASAKNESINSYIKRAIKAQYEKESGKSIEL